MIIIISRRSFFFSFLYCPKDTPTPHPTFFLRTPLIWELRKVGTKEALITTKRMEVLRGDAGPIRRD